MQSVGTMVNANDEIWVTRPSAFFYYGTVCPFYFIPFLFATIIVLISAFKFRRLDRVGQAQKCRPILCYARKSGKPAQQRRFSRKIENV